MLQVSITYFAKDFNEGFVEKPVENGLKRCKKNATIITESKRSERYDQLCTPRSQHLFP